MTMTTKRVAAVAAATLLATTSYAAAFGVNGGSLALSYGKNYLQGQDANTTALDGTVNVGVTDQLSFDVTGYHNWYNYDTSGFVDGVSGYGTDIRYAVTPKINAGVYYERLDFDTPAGISGLQFNRYGVEGTYDVTDAASVTAYYGRYSGSDVDGQNINSWGLRSDVKLNDGLGLYASYQRDHFDTYSEDLNRAAIGVDYSLEGLTGKPIMLTAEYSDIKAPSSSNIDSHELSVGVAWTFGGKTAAPTGFDGKHGVYGTFPIGSVAG